MCDTNPIQNGFKHLEMIWDSCEIFVIVTGEINVKDFMVQEGLKVLH